MIEKGRHEHTKWNVLLQVAHNSILDHKIPEPYHPAALKKKQFMLFMGKFILYFDRYTLP